MEFLINLVCSVICIFATLVFVVAIFTPDVTFKDGLCLGLAAMFFFCGFLAAGNGVLKGIAIGSAIRKEASDKRYNDIYNQGMQAAENGIPDSACPFRQSGGKYASNSPDERAWLEGWIAKTTEMNKAKGKQ